MGIYMLATSNVNAESAIGADRYLDEAVIYIGMSALVEQRLERSHEAFRTPKTNIAFGTENRDRSGRPFPKIEMTLRNQAGQCGLPL
ncbi:hypothetical protein WI29_11980 [Burkholderia ubonensis]|nr:hypothetical protein WI31_00465 [Burkholderia ubonensis]KUZ22928.1 hypothetical protein WI29_11980 [Burkholderia ubonensis]KUZ24674.1 hypothetical protein WI32_33150 [Burkholderia ubonensis]KUZ36606.1 hypothetical protein WI30_07730 [Burkholderia ubonensis]KUZ51388.1 hypothetical protein WI33_12485 [Burkholderia ubonensis]